MIYGDLIGRWGRARPEAEAVVDDVSGRRYGYGALSRDIYRLANYLREDLGIKKGDRVACLSFNRSEYITLFFALGRLGAVLVPLNFRLAPGEYDYYMKDAEPKALFFDSEHQETADKIGRAGGMDWRICFDADDSVGVSLPRALEAKGDDPPPEVEIGPDDLHLIIYTSGTTGLPKGVVLTHGMIFHNAVNTILGWDLGSADRTILHASMFYTAGWNVFTLPIFYCCGANILIRNFDADKVLDLIERERVSVFFAVPTMFQMMADSPRFEETDLSGVRFTVSGGAPLGKQIFDLYKERGIHLREGYGLTEVGPNNFMADGKPGTLGRPMPLVDAVVVDAEGREASPGVEGELWLRGPHVCAGYLNKPEATAEAIKDGWFHTGDLAKADADGHYAIVGRKKDMIISGGINIYPAEVEHAVGAHPAVQAVAVIGVPDPKWGEVGKAVVELKRGAELSLEELHAFLGDRLGRFKLPKYLAVTDELPRTAASGKIQKFILKEKFGRPEND